MQARSLSCNRNDLKQHLFEINSLLDSTLLLQQARFIAQNLQDDELLYLIDMVVMKIDDSIKRHIYLDDKVNKLITLN